MNTLDRKNLRAKYRRALLQLADLVIDLSPMGEKLYRQQETVCRALRDELSNDQCDDDHDCDKQGHVWTDGPGGKWRECVACGAHDNDL